MRCSLRPYINLYSGLFTCVPSPQVPLLGYLFVLFTLRDHRSGFLRGIS